MSEYQYYEFVAVDGPVSEESLRYARSCSSRAEVSALRWQNVYHFGDFRGNVETLLQHYGSHFHITNWGTVRLGFTLPENCLTPEAIEPYLCGGERYEQTLTYKQNGSTTLVWWEYNDESSGHWTEGDGIIDQLIGIREELLRGDYRALFLGWLGDFDPDHWTDQGDDNGLIPPIPEGLGELSPALNALIEHFPVDDDALTVAAQESKSASVKRIPITEIIENLSESDMRRLLTQVAEGRGSKVMGELQRQTYPRAKAPTESSMNCAEFAAKVLEVRGARLEQERKKAAEKQKRQEEARRKHLASVMQQADAIWTSLDPLMGQKIAPAYDQVAALLKDLHDAHQQAGADKKFQKKLADFRERYARRPAMMRRIQTL